MAVTFTSYGYDTTTANPYTEVAWADAHPSIGTGTYGVRSATDWKVTAVAGADRTVSIAAGWGWGCGVIDKTVANDTIQLDPIASGSRWDLIAVRRDWTPTAGQSQFVKVNGGATPTIPGGRNSTRGNIDDQPIALVQVTAGQTQPTGFIDLRTFTGDGGGLIGMDDLCRTFLLRVGTRININGLDWLRVVGANDTPEWRLLSPDTWTFTRVFDSDTTFTGYANLAEGTITAAPAGKYLIIGTPCLRSAAGGNGRAFVKAGNTVDPIRWELEAAFRTPSPSMVYTHPGGNLFVSTGYETTAGTATCVRSSTGVTKVRAIFLG